MVTLDEVRNLAACEGIEVNYCDTPHPLLGIMVWHPGQKPIVGLDRSLLDNPILHKEILAEEIGHVYTGTGNGITRTILSHRDRNAARKCESRGMIWQANYLVPYLELEHVILNLGLREVWELSEYFEVTHKLMWRRLNMADAVKLRHTLNSKYKSAAL